MVRFHLGYPFRDKDPSPSLIADLVPDVAWYMRICASSVFSINQIQDKHTAAHWALA